MADFIKGDIGLMYVYDGSAYRPIACITDRSLDKELNVIESQTMCNPGETDKTPGTINRTASVSGQCIDTTSVGGDTAKASYDYLDAQFELKSKLTFKYDTGLADNASSYFKGYLSSLSESATAGDNLITFDAEIAIDEWDGYVDPNA
jgi:hypothetical protein